MNIHHTDLGSRWHKLNICEQMANIGAEVGRVFKWREKKNSDLSTNSFYRALELLDFSIDDPKNKNSLKEILRVRELLVDYVLGENIYKSTDLLWNKYFLYFNYRARS